MSEKIKEQREKEAGASGSTGEKNAAKKTEKGGSDRLFHKFYLWGNKPRRTRGA